jgi:hypothetical protein
MEELFEFSEKVLSSEPPARTPPALKLSKQMPTRSRQIVIGAHCED